LKRVELCKRLSLMIRLVDFGLPTEHTTLGKRDSKYGFLIEPIPFYNPAMHQYASFDMMDSPRDALEALELEPGMIFQRSQRCIQVEGDRGLREC